MDANEFKGYVSKLYGEGNAPSPFGEANTDWQKEIFQTAVSTDHNVTVSGGLKICLIVFLSVTPIRMGS